MPSLDQRVTALEQAGGAHAGPRTVLVVSFDQDDDDVVSVTVGDTTLNRKPGESYPQLLARAEALHPERDVLLIFPTSGG